MVNGRTEKTLRWLTGPCLSDLDPIEQLGNAIELSPQVIQSTSPTFLSDHHVSRLVG